MADDPEHWFSVAEQYGPLRESFGSFTGSFQDYPSSDDAHRRVMFRGWLQRKALMDLTMVRNADLPPTPTISWDALLEYHSVHNRETWNPRVFVLATKASGSELGILLCYPSDMLRDRLPAVLEELHVAFPGRLREQEPAVAFDRTVASTAFLRNELSRGGLRASSALKYAIDACVDDYYPHGDDQNNSTHVAPYTTLVGPSGMGKSFAVRQLAKVHGRYVIYACLAPKTSMTIPDATPYVMDVFQAARNVHESIRLWKNYVRVGLALVEAAQSLAVPAITLFDLQTDTTTRGSFFRKLADMYANVAATEPELASKAHDLVQRYAANDGRRVSAATNVVAGSKRKRRRETSSYVLFCLDEAHSLLQYQAEEYARNAHDAPILFSGFRRALKQYTTESSGRGRIFALLVDKSISVARFVSASVDPTSKKVADADAMFQPILSLPTFDVALQAQEPAKQWLRNAGAYAADHSSGTELLRGPDGSNAYEELLCSLGRPLWGAYYDAVAREGTGSGHHQRTAMAAVRWLASSKLKLVENTRHRGGPVSVKLACCLALLSYRLYFYVEDQHLAKLLVSRWMRFPVHLSEDRQCLQTVQPSEPTLVLAAKDMMQARRDGAYSWQRVVKSLSQYYEDAAPASMGDAGEIVASVLLLLAADKVQPPGSAATKMFSLKSFLRALLPASALQDQMQHVAGLSGKRMYLTHIGRFVGSNDDHGVEPGHLRSAFLSGQGWLLPATTANAGFCLPVWDEHTKKLGGLLVQVRNRKRYSGMSDGLRTEAAALLDSAFESLSALHEGPVYGLFMDLQSTGDAVHWLDAGRSRVSRRQAHRMRTIVALGSSRAVYPCLADHGDIEGSLKSMLGHGDARVARGNRAIEDLIRTRNGSTLQ